MVSASRPEGLATPSSRSATAPPAGLAREPALQDGAGLRLPRRGQHRRAVGQHHDDPVVDRRRPAAAGRAGLAGRSMCGAVVALRLVRGGQPEEHHHDGGAVRDGDGLLGQGLVVIGVRPRRSRRRSARPPPAGGPARSSSSADVDPGRVDLRAAGALEPRRAGELADHRDRRRRRPRPAAGVAVVLEQHRALGARPRGPARGGRRGRRVPGSASAVPARPARGRGRRPRSSDGLVEVAGAHRVDDRPVAPPELRRHLEVEPRGDGGHPVVHRAPVRDHQPVEAPLVAQHLA